MAGWDQPNDHGWNHPNFLDEPSQISADGWRTAGKSRKRVQKGQSHTASQKENLYEPLRRKQQQQHKKEQQHDERPQQQQNQRQQPPKQQTQPPLGAKGSCGGQIVQQKKRGPFQGWKTDSIRKTSRQSQFTPDLIDIVDDEAQTSWRKREPPVDNIKIPYELIAHDKPHESIARSKQVFICPDLEHGAGHRHVQFGLWGEPDAVKAAKMALENWVIESEMPRVKTKSSAAFAKVSSLTPMQRERQEKRWRREVIKQMFRQNPTPGTRFGAIGSFHWPTAEYRPEDILGANYEALDPIRMSCATFIRFNNEHSTFEVSGRPTDVQEALLHLRKTCFQIVAAKRVPPPSHYLLHFSKRSEVPLYVYLRPYVQPQIVSGKKDHRAGTSYSPRGEGIETNVSGILTHSARSMRSLKSTTFKILTHFQYYCGNLHMRIRLGTFLAVQYLEPDRGIYDLKDYESMIGDPNFEGKTTEELGHLATENSLLSVFLKADKLLSPLEAMDWHLTDVKPTYTVIFNFKQDNTGDIRLQMSWRQTYDASVEEPMFTCITTKWTRLARDAEEPTSLMDISLQDLSTSLSWHIDIRAAQAVKETHVPSDLLAFADKIRMNPLTVGRSIHEQQNFDFIQYFPSRVPNLKSVRLSIAYGFGITGSDYTLELARFETRKYVPQKSMFPSPAPPTVSEPRWTLEIYRGEWDTMLAQNERLKVGTMVDWKTDAETWFPKDMTNGSNPDANDETDGWSQLLEKLTTIREMVSEIQTKTEEDILD